MCLTTYGQSNQSDPLFHTCIITLHLLISLMAIDLFLLYKLHAVHEKLRGSKGRWLGDDESRASNSGSLNKKNHVAMP